MEWNDVVARLQDLPPTFTRTGQIYKWLQNSFAAGISEGTYALEGITEQLDFANASGNWLDVWGQLFNIIRRQPNETDAEFTARITILLQYGKSTPAAILQYVTHGEGYNASLTENFANTSWSLTFLSAISVAQANEIARNLVYVRPAGVPFLPLQVPSGGLYLGSVNYLGAQSVTGAYIVNSTSTIQITLPANTNPSQPTLPTYYLTDPTLNPSLLS